MSSDSQSNGLKVLNGLVGVALLIALVGYVVLNYPAQPDATGLSEDAFKAAVLDSNMPVLVDFYADWCGPCRKMASVLDDFSTSNPNVKVVRVNVDKNQDIAQHYAIQSIPTLMVFKNGKMTARQTGLMSKDALRGFLEE
jgi:thioredoxin 1